MDDENIGLSETFKLIDFELEEDLRNTINWKNIAKNFKESRKDRRETTKRDLNKRVENTLISLQTTPKPKDGKSLFRIYAEQHFHRCPAGGEY